MIPNFAGHGGLTAKNAYGWKKIEPLSRLLLS
jgi:hypothetical protein